MNDDFTHFIVHKEITFAPKESKEILHYLNGQINTLNKNLAARVFISKGSQLIAFETTARFQAIESIPVLAQLALDNLVKTKIDFVHADWRTKSKNPEIINSDRVIWTKSIQN